MTKTIKINELFEKRAKLYPNKVAIINEDKEITYEKLNGMANQLAQVMINQGIKQGDLLPLFVEKEIETFIAILAILKTGAAFFLFNSEQLEKSPYPILETIRAKHIISQSNFLHYFKDYSGTIINLTCLSPLLSGVSENLTPVLKENNNDIAYGILTSGTTGNPKYVLITHQNLLNTYYSWESVYQLSQADIHLQMAAVGFDVLIGDWVRAFCSGATLVLCPQETLLQPKELYNLITQHGITCAEFVPAVMRRLLHFSEQASLKLNTFRLLLCGSDQWSMDEYRRAKQLCSANARVINSYGLSETTIDSTYFEEVEESNLVLPATTTVPAGKPFSHVKIYLLDDEGEQVPCGEEGEIYIGGSGVGSYLNASQLESQRFLIDPYDTTQKIYKTGDKGIFLSDGNLAFLGRNQFHIKHDGKRIEIATIESLLNQHQGINQALVIPEIKQTNKASLNCFIDLTEQAITYDDLRGYLKSSLPNLTIATQFFVVDKIALTINGKLDRKLSSQTVLRELKAELIPAHTELEMQLVEIWEEILQIKEVGRQNNFYDLGGSSLLFVQMIEAVNRRFEIALPCSRSIKTIRELSNAICLLNKNLPHVVEDDDTKRIAVIGGGSGAISLCGQLLDKLKLLNSNHAFEIAVFEKNEDLGPGLPYAKKEKSYLLNLSKAQMDLIPWKTGEFSAWLEKNNPEAYKSDFPPRYTFGQYLKYLSLKLQEEAREWGIQLSYFTATPVIDIQELGVNKFLVQSNNGNYVADYVVLCTGHMPSDAYQDYVGKPGYWHNPWSQDTFSKINSNESVGILGTRLTAIDIAVRLLDQNHQGSITMVSRSGLLPAVLAKEMPPYTLQYLNLESLPSSIKLPTLVKLFFRELTAALNKPCSFDSIIRSYKDITPLGWIRHEIDQAEKGKKPWQQVLFSLYPIVPDIWMRMSLENQSEFLLNYNSLFMTYLAAFPLENAYKIRTMLESSQLKVLGGLAEVRPQKEGYVLQGQNWIVETKHLFNATGPGYNVKYQLLYNNMLRHGLIQQHPLGGIDIKLQTLQTFNAKKQLNTQLFAMGELTKGQYLATTDLASVGRQASKISHCISQKIKRNPVSKTIIRNNHTGGFFRKYSLPIQCFSNGELIYNFIKG